MDSAGDVTPDMSSVELPTEWEFEDADEQSRVMRMISDGSAYLASFRWCLSVGQAYVGIAVGDVIGVFLYEIVPEGPNIGDWTWVINGDVPSAYIAVADAVNPAQALDGYLGAAEEWVERVLMPWGARLIPVDELQRLLADKRRRVRKRAPAARAGRPAALAPEVVDRIRSERAAGRSLAQIARELNATGTATAHGGAQWWPSTVRAVLRRTHA
jgi:hypothetical protein